MDVISCILCYLPEKSLCKFKAVSKSWHDLISDPIFQNLYINHRRSRLRILLINPLPPLTFLSISAVDGTPTTTQSQPLPASRCLLTILTCHGLICFRSPIDQHITVMNPTTKHHVLVPTHDLFCPYILGFDEYKILCGMDRSFAVFSGSWKTVKGPPFPVSCYKNIACVNGMVHLFPEQRRGSCIARFDLEKEEWSVIENVPTVPFGDWFSMMKELSGSLLLIHFCSRKKQQQMWLMKKDSTTWVEYNVLDELVSEMKSEGEDYICKPDVIPMAVMDDGRVMVYLTNNNSPKLIYYDPERKKVEELYQDTRPRQFLPLLYTPSLTNPMVVFRSGVADDCKDDTREHKRLKM